MARVQSFEPIVGHQPRILILGSMPGTASLQAVQYYAHPRNAFWPIMAELFGIDPTASYEHRVEELCRHPLILWDTLQACHRPGSLDSNIDAKTVRANDFPGLLKRFPGIRAILFNGATSEKYFKQLVVPNLPQSREVAQLRMPSTSPAHAGMNFEQKLSAWRQLMDFID
ncbi:MAG: DNA-deoxyinosine glycosylase [Gammaproteobacteria bacterium]|nr:DNA-deoxyinosine glycosylase [Gammaproteobacteria bacterium]